MRLADRVRRSLGDAAATPPSGPGVTERQQRISRLRREIARIEARWSRPLPRSPQRLRQDPADIDLPPEHRSVCTIEDRIGTEPVVEPTHLEQTLADVQRLLRLGGDERASRGPLRPDDLLFIDTETTGLSRAAGTVAFLVGVGRFTRDGERFEVEQSLLRQPADEPEMLATLQRRLAAARVIVSFNGRSFDLPLLRNRSLLWRAGLTLELPHVDLLPLSRRVFGRRTTNCRLGTLEREVLGFARLGDVDGSEVPAIYLDYLRTGRTAPLQRVIEHNRLDVVTMVPLLRLVARHLLDPLHWAEDGDELLSVGLAHLRWGDPSLAAACLDRGLELTAVRSTRHRLLVARAALCRASGDRSAAARLWERYVEEFPRRNLGWIELAKHHEHITRDLGRALACAVRAPDREREDVAHRIARLQRRIEQRHRRSTCGRSL